MTQTTDPNPKSQKTKKKTRKKKKTPTASVKKNKLGNKTSFDTGFDSVGFDDDFDDDAELISNKFDRNEHISNLEKGKDDLNSIDETGKTAVSLHREELELHVKLVLERAVSYGGEPISAESALAVFSGSRKSKAFSAFEEILNRNDIKLPWNDIKLTKSSSLADWFQLTPEFLNAINISKTLFPNKYTIWGRTFVTAILFGAESLAKYISSTKIDNIRREWQAFLTEDEPDSIVRWEEVIAQLKALSSDVSKTEGQAADTLGDLDSEDSSDAWLASYAADTGKGEDQLRIKRDVQAMASVIASEGITPPLSIGLFGNWGSGKTFFMNQLDREVQKRALVTRKARERGDKRKTIYAQNIASIWFNAWHFMDANLWPNLVVRIFEGLAEHIQGPNEDIDQAREKLLNSANLAKAQLKAARSNLTAIQKAKTDEEKKLAELKKERATCNEESKPRGRWELLASSALWKDLLNITDSTVLKVDNKEEISAKKAYDEVKRSIDEIQSVGALLIRLWKGWFPQVNFRRDILIWACASGLMFVLIYFVGKNYNLELVAETLLGYFTLVGGWIYKKITTAGKIATDLKQKLNNMELYITQAESAEESRVSLDRQSLQNLIREEQVVRDKILELEANERDANVKLQEVRSGRLLEKYIQERVDSADYRKNLGIIAMIRDDFERFEKLFAKSNAESNDGAFPNVDRIVLFIDDLDRCSKKRVVEVLQAVHMLLALKLFVVVVAVDPRWLHDSLAAAENLELHVDLDDQGMGDRATPLNYLEKIFQIPYTIKQLTQSGYSDYVSFLTKNDVRKIEELASEKLTNLQPQENDGTTPKDELSANSHKASISGKEITQDINVADSNESKNSDELIDESKNKSTNDQKTEIVFDDTDEEERLLNTEAISLSGEERSFLAKLGPPLIRTPRAAKRLVNCYRLLRATIEPVYLKHFIDPNEPLYVVAQLLLAIATGHPNMAGEVFDAIEAANVDTDEGAITFLNTTLVQAKYEPIRVWLKEHENHFLMLKQKHLAGVLPMVRKYTLSLEYNRVNGTNDGLSEN